VLVGWRERCGVVEQDALTQRQRAAPLEDQPSRTRVQLERGSPLAKGALLAPDTLDPAA